MKTKFLFKDFQEKPFFSPETLLPVLSILSYGTSPQGVVSVDKHSVLDDNVAFTAGTIPQNNSQLLFNGKR